MDNPVVRFPDGIEQILAVLLGEFRVFAEFYPVRI
jgi:hypothetical protein